MSSGGQRRDRRAGPGDLLAVDSVLGRLLLSASPAYTLSLSVEKHQVPRMALFVLEGSRWVLMAELVLFLTG